jgi:hypothetical protein
MKNILLFTFLALFCCSYTHANPPKDSLIAFSFGFHNDYINPIDVKILNEDDLVIFNYKTNKKMWGTKPQKAFTKRGNYTIQVKHPQKDLIISKNLYLDNSLVSVEINVAFINSLTDTSNHIYVYKHYKNVLGLRLSLDKRSKRKSAFQSSIIPNFVLTNKHDSTIYGIRYHFSANLLIATAKLDHTAYPFMMIYEDSKWIPLDCTPPDVLMNLKKGEKGKMRTSLYSICTNEDFDKNNLYKLVVPYGINNTIEEKIATNFFYTEQKIYTVAEEFIFAIPKIKLKS